jgi:hypothetical protein
MGVRADDQPHVLDAQAGLVERALQVRHRAGLVHPGVDEHDAGAGSERPRVAVRHTRPRQRETQPPHPGDDLLAASDLPAPSGFAHGAGR